VDARLILRPSFQKSSCGPVLKADRNLDILRAVAVLVVLVAHCLPASPSQKAAGHYAVLIFFVHTALVLLFSIVRQLGAPGVARRFYIQRAFRIYPLSVLCVLASLAFRISWPEHVFTPRSGLSIADNLLLVQNFLRERRSISAPLWSLSFEVQMYTVLPAVFWFLRGRGMRGALSLAAVSLALPVVEALASPFPGRLITIYFPCFISGALAYSRYGTPGGGSLGDCGRSSIAALGMVYWGSGQSVPCEWLVCMAMGLVVPVFREVPSNLVSKEAGLVARYSYGIYLSHALILWLCFQRLPAFSMAARWLLFVHSDLHRPGRVMPPDRAVDDPGGQSTFVPDVSLAERQFRTVRRRPGGLPRGRTHALQAALLKSPTSDVQSLDR
jgi:peptidoglycan/LPS O-acetylase OafA/YrhL